MNGIQEHGNTNEYILDPRYIHIKKQTENMLQEHGINFEEWPIKGFKTVGNLAKEIYDGESKLEVRADHEGKAILCRVLEPVLGVQVFAEEAMPDGKKHRLRLREAIQINKFLDGSENPTKIRIRTGAPSVGEKIKEDEDILETALRALEEELGIDQNSKLHFINERTIPKIKTDKDYEDNPQEKQSYPGLAAYYNQQQYDVILPAGAFHPNGSITRQDDGVAYAYMESQPEKNTYFVWDPITPEDEVRVFKTNPNSSAT